MSRILYLLLFIFSLQALYSQSSAELLESIAHLPPIEQIKKCAALSQSGASPQTGIEICQYGLNLAQEEAYDSTFTLRWSLSYNYFLLGMIEQSKEAIRSALPIADKTKFKESLIIGQVHMQLAAYSISTNEADSIDFHSALSLASLQEDTSQVAQLLMASVYGNKGSFLMLKGEYEEALELSISANKILEIHGDKINRAANLYRLGLCHMMIGDNEEAMTYFDDSKEMCALIKDPLFEASTTVLKAQIEMSTGTLWAHQHRYADASEKIAQSLPVLEQAQIQKDLIVAYQVLAYCQIKEARYTEAARNNEKAKALDHLIDDKYVSIGILTNQGLLATHQGKHESAEASFRQAINMSKAEGYAELERVCAEELAALYGKTKNYKDQAAMLTLESALAAKLMDKEKIKAIEDMKALYELEKKEKENLSLQIAASENEAKLVSERFQRKLMTSIALAALLLTITVLYFLKKLRNQNKQIKESEEKIEFLYKELRHGKTNGLRVIKQFIDSAYAKNKSWDEFHPDITGLIQAAIRLHAIIYEGENCQHIDMNVLLHSIIDYQEQIHDVTITREIDVEFQPDGNHASYIILVLNEIITNSFKYALKTNEDPTIFCRSNMKGELAELIIGDNGQGIRSSSPNGFGMEVISGLVKQVRGLVKLQSDQEGTVYTLEIPNRNYSTNLSSS